MQPRREARGDGAGRWVLLRGKVARSWSLGGVVAFEMARRLEEYGVWHFEEPIPAYDYAGLAQLADAVDIPIAAGEQEYQRWQFRDLILQAKVDILQADVIKCGGITEFKKIAAMADTYYIPVAPHNPNGPICTVASIHACVSIPNFLILEFFEPDEAVFNEIIPGGLRGDRGSIPPIEGPGLGITISDDFLKKHAFDEKKTDEMEKRVFDTITFR